MKEIIEQWLKNKIDKKEIATYLLGENIHSVIIYGAGKIGEMLYDDLNNCEEISVQCFLDKNADSLYYGIDDMNIFSLSEVDRISAVDAIIITPYKMFESITTDLKKIIRFDTRYLAIDDIIWGVE